MYDQTYFAKRRRRYAADYRRLAQIIQQHILRSGSVLDVGCGNGLLMEPLRDLGFRVQGVEPARAAIHHTPEILRDLIVWQDFMEGPAPPKELKTPHDLVCCIEVAEHIPADRAEDLVERLVARARKRIYFSAASPYQPGTGHVNCQSQFYWLELFRSKGAQLDWDSTSAVWRDTLALGDIPWVHHNGLVLSIN